MGWGMGDGMGWDGMRVGAELSLKRSRSLSGNMQGTRHFRQRGEHE